MKLIMENWRGFIKESTSGRKLDHYATLISREVVEALKHEDIKNTLQQSGEVNTRLDIEDILEELEWVRDVYINIKTGNAIDADASYDFPLDATDEQRRESDMTINITLPADYDETYFSALIPELKDALRHELEHSGQPTDTLMGVQEKIPGGDIWKSLETVEDYYTSEAEVAGHVTGLYKKAKTMREPMGEVIDDYLLRVHQTALSSGYSEGEINPLMSKIREYWRYYTMSRYPNAEIDLERS